MQTNQERNYNFVGINDTLAAIPDLEPCDIDARDEVIGELKTSLEKITNLRDRGYLFNDRTAALLAAKGEFDLLKFCVEELGCPVREEAFSRAAEGGHIECMRFTENYKHDPMDALYKAIAAGQLEAIKYIMAPCTRVPDMERIRFYQQKGGFPEIKTYLVSILGDF
ncbi:hypothetical protein [Cedratvirus kamchatka]|uniref:Ankyrin repeat-containing protein n=1 Tax=Cedratvirus kamchatka TaxID=2716914 RepID=A0A6G8MX83_9VIRU|nr:hypothetical protein [Cedratvirus kamchatka]